MDVSVVGCEPYSRTVDELQTLLANEVQNGRFPSHTRRHERPFDGQSRTFFVATGAETDIALWGGGPNGEHLIVTSRDQTIVQTVDLRYVAKPLGSNLSRIRLKTRGPGRTLIEACLGTNGPAWAGAFVQVGHGAEDRGTYTGNESSIDLPVCKPPEDAFFFVAPTHFRRSVQYLKPIYDESSGGVIGYMYTSSGYFEFYDLVGNLIATDEIGLETPVLDPIDAVMIVGGLATGVGKGLLRLGAGAAMAGARVTIRALTAAALNAMRGAYQAVLSYRTLRFTATTAARMATKGRYVPVHIMKLAVKYGKREVDPQKVKGAFRYTIQMIRNEKTYTLEVVLREADSTVLHFGYF